MEFDMCFWWLVAGRRVWGRECVFGVPDVGVRGRRWEFCEELSDFYRWRWEEWCREKPSVGFRFGGWEPRGPAVFVLWGAEEKEWEIDLFLFFFFRFCVKIGSEVLVVKFVLICVFLDYENYYPKAKKEMPKGSDPKEDAKGVWRRFLFYIFWNFCWSIVGYLVSIIRIMD